MKKISRHTCFKILKVSFLVLVVIFISCNRIPDNVARNLEQAGDNKNELLKVIKHYENDEEKLAAAYFLIGNMDTRFSREGDFSAYYKIFDLVDSLDKLGVARKEIENVAKPAMQDLEKKLGPVPVENCSINEDLEYIDAEYLIKNIDQAFEVRKTKLWCKNVDFSTFCNFSLPYRVYEEPLSDFRTFFRKELAWLDDSLKNKSDMAEACRLVNNFMYSKFIFVEEIEKIPPPSAVEMYKLGAGNCEQRYYMIVSAMRSVGLPVAIAFTVQWNHWAGRHSWVSLQY